TNISSVQRPAPFRRLCFHALINAVRENTTAPTKAKNTPRQHDIPQSRQRPSLKIYILIRADPYGTLHKQEMNHLHGMLQGPIQTHLPQREYQIEQAKKIFIC
ncbi:hypothetical protein Tsp_14703, partial [Trichinella spiralis]